MVSKLGNDCIKKYILILIKTYPEITEEIKSFSEEELMDFTAFLQYYMKLTHVTTESRNRIRHVLDVIIVEEIKLRQSPEYDLNEADMSLRPTISLSLDNDGNMLLTKREHVNFQTIYANSHELLKVYSDSNNIEGMKYELCKLWMCKTLIDNNILYNKGIRAKLVSSKQKKQAQTTKSFIMSDIKKYLKEVNEKETNFNFQEYFNKTQFGIEVYKIDNRVIKASKLIFGAFK